MPATLTDVPTSAIRQVSGFVVRWSYSFPLRPFLENIN